MSNAKSGFAVLWREPVEQARVEVTYGRLAGDPKHERGRTVGHIEEAMLGAGARATRVTVRTDDAGRGFTFFLRDVSGESPVLIPSLGAAVVPVGDSRTYAEVESAVRARKLVSDHDRYQREPEESYESACRATRDMLCPTWLALGRDLRLFRVRPLSFGRPGSEYGYWGEVAPAYHSVPRDTAPDGKAPPLYVFEIGRGSSCSIELERRLDDGALPILRSIQRDGDVEYRVTMFATLETQPVTNQALRGSHPTAAYANTGGRMLTETEQKLYDDELRAKEIVGREEELVCWAHVEVVNTGQVPRYAFAKYVNETAAGTTYDEATGASVLKSGDLVAGVSLLDGKPFPQSEVAVLVAPGKSVTIDYLMPHRPISRDRAAKIAQQDFRRHYDAARAYWQQKLDAGAKISLPEPAIDERVRAGLLHLDLNTLGMNREGPLLACVGWYSPIGSESSPMIQFFDSMGWHDVAARCIDFFLERQSKDGFIQTFGGYQLETGPTLWTAGEHWRYTRDVAWAKRVKDRILKSAEYLLEWRRRNLTDKARAAGGYGLLDGKVADPQDFFHSFMLNGLSYVGVARVAEIYAEIDPETSKRLAREASAFREDIRASYLANVERSPVLPMSDGTWLPTFAPWSEFAGPVSLYADGGAWSTHGAFNARDSLIGALYLVIGEVFDATERASEWMLRVHQELMTYRNAGYSQPYYCRHDFLHLKRGEVKEYLKTFYNQMTGLQDRETYTFWEHYFHASQHKTHEEGWFLMQTRWMLWEENGGDELRLLSMIPRAWMEGGKSIELKGCVSHFGRFDLSVQSSADQGRIDASVRFHDASRRPKRLRIRLPHPQNRVARESTGGRYDPAGEAVMVDNVGADMRVAVSF